MTRCEMFCALALTFLLAGLEQEWAAPFRTHDPSSALSRSAPAVAQQPQAATNLPASSSQNATSSSQAAPQSSSLESNVPQYFVPSDYAYFTAEKKPAPIYPPNAAARKIGGEVVLAVGYLTEGTVWSVEKLTGDPTLADAGVQAVKRWKFRPLKEKGQHVRGVTDVGFYFEQPAGSVISAFPYGEWKHEEPTPASSAAGSTPQQVRVESGVIAGRKLKGENPRYPESAKHDRIQGVVMLLAKINKEGHVSLLGVMKAPSLDLAIASLAAVKTWEYQPFTLKGQPVEVLTTIQVNYTLR
jgi:TonB family protein